jgi:ABC-type branched-subunit amino acid transport system substrate-binding protein
MTRLTALLIGGCLLTAAIDLRASGSEQRGKDIYSGTAATGIKARVGVPPVDAPATLLACVNCHGADGKGKAEGQIVPSDITWDALTKPYGVTHASGRTHQPYTERLLVRAICLGIDPAGHELHATMPRFQMSREDAGALIQYLKRLGSDADPGLSESTLAIGTVAPAGSPSAAVLHAYFDTLNKQGGVYGRRVELTETTPETLISGRPPFAIVAGGAGADQAILAAAETHRIPLVGSQTRNTDAGGEVGGYTFSLLSGVEQQARALLAYAERRGWDDLRIVDLDRDGRAARERAQEMKASNVTHVLLRGDGRGVLDLAREAARIGWSPVLLIPGSLATSDLLEMPAALSGRVFLALPSLPSDQTQAGSTEYRALADAYQLPRDEIAMQIAALGSAKVLTQGLKIAGRSISRAALVTALEGLANFDTGLTPRIGFGPNRRIGAPGAYIVAVDLAAQRFTQVTEWMSIN